MTHCLNCNSLNFSEYDHENGYELVKCSHCGLLYVKNPPSMSQINESHKQGVHKGQYAFDMSVKYSIQSENETLQRLSDIFENTSLKGSWLDIGCGNGELLVALKRKYGDQLNLLGSEPNLKKQNIAKSKGLSVDFIDIQSHSKNYDFISMMNLFSHLPSPRDFIKNINKLLKPEGMFLLQTGDTADLPASKHYKPYFLPDHLSFPNEKILRSILTDNGFKIEIVKRYPFRKINLIVLIKETIKLFLPRYNSIILQIKNFQYWNNTNIYILAKKISNYKN